MKLERIFAWAAVGILLVTGLIGLALGQERPELPPGIDVEGRAIGSLRAATIDAVDPATGQVSRRDAVTAYDTLARGPDAADRGTMTIRYERR